MNPASFQKPIKKIFPVLLVLMTLSFFSGAQPVEASVPQLMTYQGLLKNASGSYLTGTYSMTFRIYNASTGGTALWTETQSTVSVSSGSCSVQLGSVQALTLPFTEGYWLSVQVGADAEMTPRVRLTSVGYSYRSDEALNGFTQSQHDAMTHKNIEGVRDNTVNIAKTNFKLDAYSLAAANSMGDMVVDTFNDASGIDSGSSSGYTWRGSPHYDVVATAPAGGIDSYAKLMLHTNGTNGSTTFTDSSSGAFTVTASGNAHIDTAQSKFGGASGVFDGTGDYLSVAGNSAFDLGTGDFAIDFWVRFNAFENSTLIDVGSNSGVRLYITDSKVLQAILNNSAVLNTGALSLSTGVWYHLALTRTGTSLRFFKDGTQVGSTITDSTSLGGGTANGVKIGDGTGAYAGLDFNGWIDELRISKGSSRWSANFTPPSGEYTVPNPQTATVISGTFTEPAAPSEALVIADETLNTGSVVYYVSRNNGSNWTACTKETVCSISGQPSGTQLKWKAVVTGEAELNAVAVAV